MNKYQSRHPRPSRFPTTKSWRIIGVAFDCEALLDFEDVDVADCNWFDATSLSASVSGSLGFLPGGNVTMNAGVVKSACDDGYRCECLAYANASTAVA